MLYFLLQADDVRALLQDAMPVSVTLPTISKTQNASSSSSTSSSTNRYSKLFSVLRYEPPNGKTNNLHSENKDTDQLRGNREADQRLCFRYSDSTILLLLKSEISSF